MNSTISSLEMAEEMVNAISPLGDSEAADFIYSSILGTVDTAKDYGYLVYDYLDTDSRYQKDNDKYRLAKMAKDGIGSEKINQTLRIVYDDYYQKLTDEQKQLLLRRQVASMAGGAAVNNYLFGHMTSTLIASFWPRFVTGLAITTTYTLGGKIARATYRSRQLMVESPELYWKLRTAGDLDLLYFLIEKHTEPFIKASKIRKNDPGLFNEINDKFLSLEW